MDRANVHQAASKLFIVVLMLTTSAGVQPALCATETYCKTPTGHLGSCIPILQCKGLLDKLPSPLTPAHADYLKTFHCEGLNGRFDGQFPNVCCRRDTRGLDSTDRLSHTFGDRDADLEYTTLTKLWAIKRQ